MESSGVEIKPTISTDDIPAKSLLTLGSSKFKQSRYEDVWPEDVHAAFMEAVALYPPMGKRRLRYYRISSHENEHFSDANRFRSFGRCQLIQSYILEKTGKNRTRKQVSSHLQRLKKIHKDNPALRFLFSEHSQPPSDHYSVQEAVPVPVVPSQDIPCGTRRSKNDFDFTVNIQSADTIANNDNSPTFPYASDLVTSFESDFGNTPNLSANRHNKPSRILFSQELDLPQHSPESTFRPSNNDYFSELQDPLLFKEAVNGGFRVDSTFNTSAFSMSMGRFASRLYTQDRADSCPTTHISRADYTPAFQPAHRWTSYDDMMDSFLCTPLLTPARQWFHAPFCSLESFSAEKQSVLAYPWASPQNFDVDRDLREIPSRYPPTVYRPSPTYSEARLNSPPFQSSLSESEGSQFSQGISYSFVATSPATVPEGTSTESAVDFAGQVSPENLASPVIMPTPVYPISYIHSDEDAYTPTSNLLSHHPTAT